MEHLLSRKAKLTVDSAISYLLKVALETPGVISLAAGLVDQESLPSEGVSKLLKYVQDQKDCRQPSLQYGTNAGLMRLRKAVLDYLRKADEAPYPEEVYGPQDVVITNGSQQFLHMITECLVDPGDIVLVSDPTYFVYMGKLESAGARVFGIELDEDGMVPESLERTIEQIKADNLLSRLKMIYVTTYYQNPTGMSLAPERREKIFKIVQQLDAEGHFVCLLEDTAYRELYFDKPAGPSIKTLDVGNRYVALTGSFSKAFAPGLRLGYALMPDWLTPHVLRQKGNEDFGSSNLCQHLAWATMETGEFYKHGDRLRQTYKKKAELMIEAIEEHFPKGVRWWVPRGGLYVWVILPSEIETGGKSELFKVALDHKVLYTPGEYCYATRPEGPPDRSSMRLTFALLQEDEIVEGIRRLGNAIEQVMKTRQIFPGNKVA